VSGTVILVTNGPGELQTWVRPVLHELQRVQPDLRSVISLIPCQFASGGETQLAATFGASAVTSPQDTVRFLAGGATPAALHGERGVVVSMGGNTAMAVRLGRKLGFPTYRYSFIPYWHRGLKKLFVHSDAARQKARLLNAPAARVENIGNLVADAMQLARPAAADGKPQILIMAGSRERYTRAVLPLLLEVVDNVFRQHPGARFSWPVSRLLGEDAVAQAIAATGDEMIGGIAGECRGNMIHLPSGARIEMIGEDERYAAMLASDLALTIPGTNTLELGIAGVPAVVILPLNKPEIIPLEGPGHWLSLIPFIGTPLKRHAVRLFVQRMNYPVSLPNLFSGETLMTEIRGILSAGQVTGAVLAELADSAKLASTRARLLETMPKPGAARKLVQELLLALGEQA
jgi:lipid-A-disaccharide synthase